MDEERKYEERPNYLDFEIELYKHKFEAYKEQLEEDLEEYLGPPSEEEALEDIFEELKDRSSTSDYEEENRKDL